MNKKYPTGVATLWAAGRTGVVGFVVALALVGCAVMPPVQEMSDARQAIRAAREAQAERFAPDDLEQAERYLQLATQDLERGAYEQARSAALAAKSEAIAARDRALEKTR